MELGFDDITLSIDIEREEGVADSGDLDTDLTSLLQVAGEAARAGAPCWSCSSMRCSTSKNVNWAP